MRTVGIDTEKLGAAFRALRSEGLIAKQRFMCCGNCAGSAIANQVAAMPEAKRAKVRGVVTFNRQDADRLDDGGSVFLQYGNVICSGVGEFGMGTEEVGKLAVAKLRAAGLRVRWDGRPEKKIEIVPTRLDRMEIGARAKALDEARFRRDRYARVTLRGWDVRFTRRNNARRWDLAQAWNRTSNLAGAR